jgi:hypothetical protein
MRRAVFCQCAGRTESFRGEGLTAADHVAKSMHVLDVTAHDTFSFTRHVDIDSHSCEILFAVVLCNVCVENEPLAPLRALLFGKQACGDPFVEYRNEAVQLYIQLRMEPVALGTWLFFGKDLPLEDECRHVCRLPNEGGV